MASEKIYESAESVYHAPEVAEDGEIKNYAIERKKYYPHLMLEKESISVYYIQVLKNMVKPLQYIHDNVPDGYYFVYIRAAKKTACIGMVHSDNLRAILQGSLFKDTDKYLMIDKEKKIEDTLMFSYCTSSQY